jgi:hypothetical protein
MKLHSQDHVPEGSSEETLHSYREPKEQSAGLGQPQFANPPIKIWMGVAPSGQAGHSLQFGSADAGWASAKHRPNVMTTKKLFMGIAP